MRSCLLSRIPYLSSPLLTRNRAIHVIPCLAAKSEVTHHLQPSTEQWRLEAMGVRVSTCFGRLSRELSLRPRTHVESSDAVTDIARNDLSRNRQSIFQKNSAHASTHPSKSAQSVDNREEIEREVRVRDMCLDRVRLHVEELQSTEEMN